LRKRKETGNLVEERRREGATKQHGCYPHYGLVG